MTLRGSEDLWIVEPLLDAGLDLDEVRTLLTWVSFESVVSVGWRDVSDATVFLGFRSPAVRAAWIETVDRMLRMPEPRKPVVSNQNRAHGTAGGDRSSG